MVTGIIKIIIPSLTGDNGLEAVWKAKDVWFWTEIASDVDRGLISEGWPRGMGERWESPWGSLVEKQAQDGKKPRSRMAMGWFRKMNEPCQLLLCNDALLSLLPFSCWDKKEPIRWPRGFQWLSKRGPSTTLGCSVLENFLSVERRAWEENWPVVQSLIREQNWSHISKDPRELGWGQGLLQMMSRIL